MSGWLMDNNTHGNKNWPKKNNCANCAQRTFLGDSHCKVIQNPPRQKCPWFKGVNDE